MSARSPAHLRIERVRALLQAKLQPVRLEIRDDSEAHAHHPGAGGKGHYRLLIVAPCFAGLTLVQLHRLVHDALSTIFADDIHALKLTTRAPDESL